MKSTLTRITVMLGLVGLLQPACQPLFYVCGLLLDNTSLAGVCKLCLHDLFVGFFS